ncbi:MAG: hypothetical protein ACFFFG_00625 [Candidatus Thorarchaeota archaeon]
MKETFEKSVPMNGTDTAFKTGDSQNAESNLRRPSKVNSTTPTEIGTRVELFTFAE